MKSGMTAAEAVENALEPMDLSSGAEIDDYKTRLEKTWLWDELQKSRNIRPGFRAGLILGLINAGIDTVLFRGKAPWTLRNHHDHEALQLAAHCQKIDYPKLMGL